MKKIALALLVVACMSALCYAADKTPKATEPVGAVVEMTGVVVGSVADVISEATGTGKGSIKIESATGETKIFPVDESVRIVDTTLNTLTLNQLKKGEKVTVEYSKEAGAEKAKTISVQK